MKKDKGGARTKKYMEGVTNEEGYLLGHPVGKYT